MEIKLGATISEDYFKGLRIFSARLPAPPCQCAVIHGDNEQQRRSGITIFRIGDVAEMMSALS